MQHKNSKPVTCKNCGQTWPRDPALEVACPVCKAPIGAKCITPRPSEHKLSAGFTGNTKGFNDGVHDERDILAMQSVPGYGKCIKPKKEDESHAN